MPRWTQIETISSPGSFRKDVHRLQVPGGLQSRAPVRPWSLRSFGIRGLRSCPRTRPAGSGCRPRHRRKASLEKRDIAAVDEPDDAQPARAALARQLRDSRRGYHAAVSHRFSSLPGEGHEAGGLGILDHLKPLFPLPTPPATGGFQRCRAVGRGMKMVGRVRPTLRNCRHQRSNVETSYSKNAYLSRPAMA